MGRDTEGFRRPAGIRNDAERVSAEPFVGWLNGVYEDEKRHGGTYSERIAARLGLCSTSPTRAEASAAVRCLYRLRTAKLETRRDGKRVVLPATEYVREDVQAMCDHYDGSLFSKLYPDADEHIDFFADPLADLTLEPDAWCPYCKRNVTPIDGLCPWCMCEHGHIFREVGFTESGFACLECAKTGRRRGVMSADRLSAAFEGDGVTDEMVERLRSGETPLPLARKDGYSQAVKLRDEGLSWTNIAYVMKAYHGVDCSEYAWRRIYGVWEEAAA